MVLRVKSMKIVSLEMWWWEVEEMRIGGALMVMLRLLCWIVDGGRDGWGGYRSGMDMGMETELEGAVRML